MRRYVKSAVVLFPSKEAGRAGLVEQVTRRLERECMAVHGAVRLHALTYAFVETLPGLTDMLLTAIFEEDTDG